MRRLYETNSWDEARSILQKYNIRYVILEHWNAAPIA
jgi:uncharacterized membrane protein